MANVLDSMMGVLPLVIVGGIATKMTDRLMSQSSQPRKQVSRRKRVTKSYTRKSSGFSFGNFSNIGY